MKRARPGKISASRRKRWFVFLLCALLLVFAIDALVDEPLREYIEGKVNASLVGYTTTIQSVDFKLFNFALDVENLTIVQDAHPDPPVAQFPGIAFNVQWRALLFGRLVADCTLAAPALFVNRIQLLEEAGDEVDIDKRGWQRALEALYPLEVNWLRMTNGRLTYIDDDPQRPLELSEAMLVARNIRNVISPERTYPSEVRFEGQLFDSGRVTLDGHADILAEPYPGALAEIVLEEVPVERLGPVAEHADVHVSGGTLDARGQVEWHPSRRALHLREASLAGVRVDYVHDPERARRAIETVKRLKGEGESVELRLDRLVVTDGELGFVSRANEKKPWKVFLADAHVEVTDYTNDPGGEPARFAARGRFMDSGDARLDAVFRSDANGPDFEVAAAIESTELATLNDLLRATAGFDVVDGDFSLYAELAVADGAIDGYVKPLFSDVDVYDPVQDKGKNVFRKAYEGLAEGVADILENRQRDEIATVVELGGSLDDPNTSNLEIALRLIENAFFDAILPGFEREVDRGPDGRALERRKQRKLESQD